MSLEGGKLCCASLNATWKLLPGKIPTFQLCAVESAMSCGMYGLGTAGWRYEQVRGPGGQGHPWKSVEGTMGLFYYTKWKWFSTIYSHRSTIGEHQLLREQRHKKGGHSNGRRETRNNYCRIHEVRRESEWKVNSKGQYRKRDSREREGECDWGGKE